MTQWKDIPFVGPAYADDDRLWSVQDTVNMILVTAEQSGTASRAMLRCLPGFSTFADLGTGSPIRGARNVEGKFLVVSGTSLFLIAPNGTTTNLGTIPGVGRVSMSHNQITGGNQVAIANGYSGYVYNTVTGVLGQITDPGFPGAKCFEYLDSYILGVEPAGRYAFTSDLADATSYNTLDQYEAEGSPDLIVGQIVTHREWWLMGQRTIEPFQDTGAGTGTFQRSQGLVMERGLASTFGCAELDNSVFWVGDDGVVYRANGYTPVRISTFAIEQALAQCNLAQCFVFTYEDRGHKVFYVTCPDGMTFGYDVASSSWHRRSSKSLDRWRINTLTNWNGGWYAGDFSNGKIYKLDWNLATEDGQTMDRRRITGVLSDQENQIIVNRVKLVMNTGQPGVRPDDSVDFRYSTDGGSNWSDWRKLPIGSTGSFAKNIVTNRLGRGSQWVFDMRLTDPVQADLLGASMMLEGTAS